MSDVLLAEAATPLSNSPEKTLQFTFQDATTGKAVPDQRKIRQEIVNEDPKIVSQRYRNMGIINNNERDTVLSMSTDKQSTILQELQKLSIQFQQQTLNARNAQIIGQAEYMAIYHSANAAKDSSGSAPRYSFEERVVRAAELQSLTLKVEKGELTVEQASAQYRDSASIDTRRGRVSGVEISTVPDLGKIVPQRKEKPEVKINPIETKETRTKKAPSKQISSQTAPDRRPAVKHAPVRKIEPEVSITPVKSKRAPVPEPEITITPIKRKDAPKPGQKVRQVEPEVTITPIRSKTRSEPQPKHRNIEPKTTLGPIKSAPSPAPSPAPAPRSEPKNSFTPAPAAPPAQRMDPRKSFGLLNFSGVNVFTTAVGSTVNQFSMSEKGRGDVNYVTADPDAIRFQNEVTGWLLRRDPELVRQLKGRTVEVRVHPNVNKAVTEVTGSQIERGPFDFTIAFSVSKGHPSFKNHDAIFIPPEFLKNRAYALVYVHHELTHLGLKADKTSSWLSTKNDEKLTIARSLPKLEAMARELPAFDQILLAKYIQDEYKRANALPIAYGN